MFERFFMKKLLILFLFCFSLQAETKFETVFQPEQIHVIQGSTNLDRIQKLLDQGFTVKHITAYRDNGPLVAVIILSPPTPESLKNIQAQKTFEYNKKLQSKILAPLHSVKPPILENK